jgi:ketosteroid isomerase-like protein
MTTNEEVLQTHRKYMAAHDTGDLTTLLQLVHPDFTYFHTNHSLKGEAGDPAILQAIYEAGYRAQLSLHHNEAQVYGDSAVVTCYFTGQFTWAGGNRTSTGAWRYTGVWVKVGEQWKIVHGHASPLSPAQTVL